MCCKRVLTESTGCNIKRLRTPASVDAICISVCDANGDEDIARACDVASEARGGFVNRAGAPHISTRWLRIVRILAADVAFRIFGYVTVVSLLWDSIASGAFYYQRRSN